MFPPTASKGLLLSRDDVNLVEMIASYSNQARPPQGRQLPVMYSSKSRASSPFPATWPRR